MLFFNGGTAMKIGSPPHKNVGLKTSNLFSENSDSTVLGRPLRGNEEEFCEN